MPKKSPDTAALEAETRKRNTKNGFMTFSRNGTGNDNAVTLVNRKDRSQEEMRQTAKQFDEEAEERKRLKRLYDKSNHR